MLAYELFLQNTKSGLVSGKGHPIKKIFIKNNKVTIDDTPIDNYVYIDTPDNLKNSLQKNFGMPLDTVPQINLPNKIVSPNSPKPYVKINGYVKLYNKFVKIKGEKQQQLRGEITLGDKKNAFARLLLPNMEVKIDEKDISYKMNKSDYRSGDESLYNKYVKSKILIQDKLPAALFLNIAKFFLIL